MTTPTWYQDAIGYQIYPRSFADSNGDGVGDLRGIINKLDYLKSLGINLIWFSPFYPSPQFDVGYDVANYTDIDPEYGTLAEFDELLAECHKRGIRVMLDYVMNHTSEQHEWFQKSRQSRDNAYADWYMWHDGVDGEPPNDWEAGFGGSAWTFDEQRGQFYYHFFFKEQPDLNWNNPDVKEAMFNVVRFWLDRGIDGFRIDAISTLFEDPDLTPVNDDRSIAELWLERFESGGEWANHIGDKLRYQHGLPALYGVLRDLRKLVATEYPDRVLLGEESDVRLYGNGTDQLHSLFNFDWADISAPDAPRIRKMLQKRLAVVPDGAWECNTVGNHDRPRSFGKVKSGKHNIIRYEQALAVTMFLQGTPMFYYGEEIGMSDFYLEHLEQFRDNIGVWAYNALIDILGKSESDALKLSQEMVSRDKNRTPMQWENAPNAGFSPEGVETWLPMNPDFSKGINVADQESDPASILNRFRELTKVRHEYPSLRRGRFDMVNAAPQTVFGFWRHYEQESCIVAFNMSAEPVTASLGMTRVHKAYSNVSGGMVDPTQLRRFAPHLDLAALPLHPYEIFIGIV